MFEQAILYLVAVIALVIGFLVLRGSESRSMVRISFFCICVTLAVWALSLGWFLSATSAQGLDISSRLFYISAAVFCPLMLLFSLSFPRGAVGNGQQSLVRAIIMITAIFVLYVALVPQFVVDVEYYAAGGNIDFSQMQIDSTHYIVFSLFFLTFFISAMVSAGIKWSRSRGRERLQIKAFALGMLIASVPGFIVDLYLPSVGEYTFVWAGPLAILLFLGVIAYSIVRLGMFDIRAAVARTITYLLLVGTLAGIYFVAAYTFSVILFSGQSDTGVGLGPINILLALLLAFIFQPIKHFFDQLTNRIFYRGTYDSETFLREFGQILSHDTDLRLLLKQVSSYFTRILGADRVFFVISEQGVLGADSARKSRIPNEDLAHIEAYYSREHDSPEAIVAELVQDREIKRLLMSHRVHIVLPLILQSQTVGYVFVGEHKGSGYRARDIRTLESVANELAIAVQNSLSVEEIRELNETLQRRVSEATKELRASNKQLQRLDEAKDEFISMASHQLRTPLTSIKGYLDMMLEGDLGKISATQRAVLSEAFISSERMVTLINDFLNISRLQTGKFTIERRESNVAEAVAEQVALLDIIAKQHSLKIDVKIDKGLPLLNVDIDKLRQVILNMVDNAIYYSQPDTTIKVSLSSNNKDVIFTVKDAGIGVPKEDQAGLFGKFFRASNARRKRPDGTGVGLFLAKKVILSHGGQVIFESEEGKGSTFGFRIPLKSPKLE